MDDEALSLSLVLFYPFISPDIKKLVAARRDEKNRQNWLDCVCAHRAKDLMIITATDYKISAPAHIAVHNVQEFLMVSGAHLGDKR